ncbi:uncharacterized protein LOC131848984 [Achroia grisella]|uniref:uncharacterized protein LOC131848984 n=1 Tax=Achroia grisella TaxID=688607 RepID=UPI0027D1FB64|nr:uncharacterized protein LOC131848984 [Achroia grisella]
MTGLQSTIVQLQEEIAEKERSELLNDVEISGVPEFEAESVENIIITVAAKLGISMDERDIVSASRVGLRRGTSTGGDATEGMPRPRPLAVRLTRRLLRDQLLRAARVRRHASTADMGLPQHEPQRLYVNERLTKTYRSLFGRAREATRRQRWRFVWTRNGRVYVRRDVLSPVHTIRQQADIDRIFSTDASPVYIQ